MEWMVRYITRLEDSRFQSLIGPKSLYSGYAQERECVWRENKIIKASRDTQVEFVAKPTDGRRSAHKPKEETK